jgi:hypothetical protein
MRVRLALERTGPKELQEHVVQALQKAGAVNLLGAQVLDAVAVAGDEVLPAPGRELGHPVEPARIELGADILISP